jgi:hypothetical protein
MKKIKEYKHIITLFDTELLELYNHFKIDKDLSFTTLTNHKTKTTLLIKREVV